MQEILFLGGAGVGLRDCKISSIPESSIFGFPFACLDNN